MLTLDLVVTKSKSPVIEVLTKRNESRSDLIQEKYLLCY